MRSRTRARRGRPAAPAPLPPWWSPNTGGTRPRVPSRPEPSSPPEPPGHDRPGRGADHQTHGAGPGGGVAPADPDGFTDRGSIAGPAGGVDADEDVWDRYDAADRDELLTHDGVSVPPWPSGPQRSPQLDDAAAPEVWPPDPEPASQQTRQPLPGGHWTDPAGSATGVWIPDSAAAPASSATTATATSPTARPERSSELEASRPADRESHRVRTSVDRPVSSLRPVSIDEARQLAECFALDYMSCDEDDPQLRQLALAPYLSRRADALLGWPTERAGLGRQRAITARAGECLAQDRWVTVDVSVLVEIYRRDGSTPTDTSDPGDHPIDRPELPPDARWSAVPPAHAPGWVCSMTVWHRLGIPIRRHDSGGLVVELFTVSEPES